MTSASKRNQSIFEATNRPERCFDVPKDNTGKTMKVSEYFGENVFDFRTAEGIPEAVRVELLKVAKTPGKKLKREHVEVVATAATEWATQRGATHFCHWFQPLTGSTAEKHDAFLAFKGDKPIEKISVTQLMQGEPDASSFPNGGSRSTFEARGYTAWDITSPMFLTESTNGKTLCIPTAFVSYSGQALDIKTPLLRSINRLDASATKFLQLTGKSDAKHVTITCGAEQEYFLIDKAFVAARPDLVMTGRTLFGSLSARNQQLSDHYFGEIPERVLSFMQELDHELYKLGVPAKTRHNEVAPSQFEMAPIFNDANVSADQNQMMMAVIKKTAHKHNFEAILHEKPFAGINGSGKHLNWSMSDNNGYNLLEPGSEPHQNLRFLATMGIVCEAVYRHGDTLRMAISGHGNDHRLGGHEAPPSIISVFLGDTLNHIVEALLAGKTFTPDDKKFVDVGADQLAQLMRDNTDRNRTSPFAFTGNKFEFRAVGSSQNIGFPMSVLNAAVTEVFNESNTWLEKELAGGKSVDQALQELTLKWIKNCKPIIFNGDGYSEEWVKEAAARGLPNLKNTPEALGVLTNKKSISFLTEMGVYKAEELETRYNVLIEKYVLAREIEFRTQTEMVSQYVIPSALEYKSELVASINASKQAGVDFSIEKELLSFLDQTFQKVYSECSNLKRALETVDLDQHETAASKFAEQLMPMSDSLANQCNELEELIPDHHWCLPKYREMLFLR
tara:strand:+ start:3213 stop:5408 length:2196 start_codon:yes stop_codon:yes gene_type:complete